MYVNGAWPCATCELLCHYSVGFQFHETAIVAPLWAAKRNMTGTWYCAKPTSGAHHIFTRRWTLHRSRSPEVRTDELQERWFVRLTTSFCSSAHALGGVSGVASFITTDKNSYNKTEAAVFSCRLCFLRAFHFISLIYYLDKNFYKRENNEQLINKWNIWTHIFTSYTLSMIGTCQLIQCRPQAMLFVKQNPFTLQLISMFGLVQKSGN